MATLTVYSKRIIDNITKLDSYLTAQDIQWTLITKMLCGFRPALEKILNNSTIKKLQSIGDSRISNLRIVKEINPEIKTMYVKPPAIENVPEVVEFADISLNSSYGTIKALNDEAKKQDKIHEVIVMIELGELREGILRDNILDFYSKVFTMSNINVIGLGTNLGCMYGVEPTYDKLIQLALYKMLIEAKFDQNLPLVSGGSSITLQLVEDKRVPPGVNHFRIGETAFLGKSLMTNKKFRNLSTSVFDFSAEILELEKKEVMPDGIISEANVGHTNSLEYADGDLRESYRCIVDFGELDVNANGLIPKDKTVQFVGTTSDMTVYDLGKKKEKYRVGAQLHFTPSYLAIARLMNSRYVTKKVM